MRPQISIGNDLPIAIKLPTHEEFDQKWIGWRVWAVDLHRETDGNLRLCVFADHANGSKQPSTVFEFLLGPLGRTASPKLVAFAAACGMRGFITSVDQLEGRYFSTRNSGKRSIDFGPLSNALAAA
ncbi:hypothetical protein [Neorhizobium alkalisoli]|uniref:Uncharacterized protein n=1 Tax=Neorhizobium alkalisoli TaxID=528178 RepID=A0A561QGZ8_9HYPH|nr:hypothetical protein [Neorhizobium alkalisoli]TWF49638.1 hypothetical protein FHW37_1074 [Neorhizobium alkalisoli]